VRLLIQHRSHYKYPRPAALGPQLVRLRPANHVKAKIESYSLRIEQDCELRWQQDPFGNHVARATFHAGSRVASLDLIVELCADIRPINPFDFFLDDRCKQVPFEYPEELRADLLPFLNGPGSPAGDCLRAFLSELPSAGETVPLIVSLNAAVSRCVRYVIREEAGIWTPDETLRAGRGSCRDSAVLLIAALRSRGLAARFVSGYLVQLRDEGMIPDEPRGVTRDVADLHAWAEVYLPGAGWVGLDATSGLLCGEGHIALACTASPALAAPLDGTSDVAAHEVSFDMRVGRLGHEPRPTAPYEEDVWQQLLASGDQADARLGSLGIKLTVGGEPTFNSREHAEAPEWNAEALGSTKWTQGQRLAGELRRRLAPGAAVVLRMGKAYPGESLPRWALDVCGRRDGRPVWSGEAIGVAPSDAAEAQGDAERLARALAHRLGLAEYLLPVYEDPWRFLQDEAALPVDVDPLAADLADSEERRRLARVLDRGLGTEAGYVLPLMRAERGWCSERWRFRRGHLFLIPGDSPIGLRLPLRSLPAAPPPPSPPEEPFSPQDPRTLARAERQEQIAAAAAPRAASPSVRTALCVEAREGVVRVFLPPLASCRDFFALVAEVDAARRELGIGVLLEGYPPPADADLYRLSVAPDPGVLEVNLPPVASLREHAAVFETIFEAALHAGLHSEKYLIDGRQAGSGGGNHITLGGETPLGSVFLRRPDVLASLLTFLQHHPSLSYMFAGLFVGPTSQAPRVDEARHDTLYELELALERAFRSRDEQPPPWLADLLFRHLLVDLAGNTHRAEVSIDKLFDPATRFGRQGLIELRAFEMPPHFRMATAQAALLRALVAAFAQEPYRRPLVRWGQLLHDRFLLPYWMWRDFEDVLAFLEERGLGLPAAAYRPFVELRCPVAGSLPAGDVFLEVRNALEPWPVLGEEITAFGTSRYVDSSVERIEVRVSGLVPERHAVLVNGHTLPLRATASAAEHVAGVRFRAWAPPHSLHAHIGIHHPIRLDVLDAWGKRSLGACAYHVWHPEGRAFDTPPLTRFEAAARRAQRFTIEGPEPWPVAAAFAAPHPDAPYTLDLRRYRIDRPPPEPSQP
jgi:uncharacterized protein (DUF2126 family)/transglutaminase-like putative cysteine protease